MGLTLGGDGEALDLWRAMRSHPVLFDVPVLACSGDLDAAASQRAEFLAKPFTLDDFDRAIQRLLADGRSKDTLPVRDAPASPTDLATA